MLLAADPEPMTIRSNSSGAVCPLLPDGFHFAAVRAVVCRVDAARSGQYSLHCLSHPLQRYVTTSPFAPVTATRVVAADWQKEQIVA
jgi:hypothetical protein